MTEQWRNPWAPVDGQDPDDDSTESSFSHSQPIEPGRVVQTAPHTILGDVKPFEPPAPVEREIPAHQVPLTQPIAPVEDVPSTPPTPVAQPPLFAPPVTPVQSVREITFPEQQSAPSPSTNASGEWSTNTVDREDADRTVLTRPSQRMWMLRASSGDTELFSAGVIIVGRKPVASTVAQEAQLVTVNDPTLTVSKTHAKLEYAGDSWFLTDLHSTNGVVLTDRIGNRADAKPGERTLISGSFLLGDLEMTMVQVGA